MGDIKPISCYFSTFLTLSKPCAPIALRVHTFTVADAAELWWHLSEMIKHIQHIEAETSWYRMTASFLKKNVEPSIKISLKFAPNGPIDNMP